MLQSQMHRHEKKEKKKKIEKEKEKKEAFLGHLFHPSAGERLVPTIYMLELFSVWFQMSSFHLFNLTLPISSWVVKMAAV